ncbi:MAG: response regulator [Methanosarcinaceae archaeon]
MRFEKLYLEGDKSFRPLLWIGTDGGGLNLYQQKRIKLGENIFTRFVNDPNNPNSLSHNHVWDICEDNNDILWITTVGGGLNKLLRVKKDNGIEEIIFKHFIHNINAPANPSSLSGNIINCLYEDKNQILWIGTLGSGLNRYDKNTDSFIRYTEDEGLANNRISGILEDNQGNLWMSTGNGLSKFNPETGKFKNYDVSDGLLENEFNNFGACFKSKAGEMFFGSAKGFISFYPDQLSENTTIPPEHLDNVFTRFYQIETDHLHEQAGSGIGLALVKELVELHRGEITVESVPGEGTTFTIILPLGKAHLKPDEIIDAGALPTDVVSRTELSVKIEKPEIALPELSPDQPKTIPIILIVEDNRDVRKYIRDYIEDNYQVIEAEDGVQGLDKAVSTIPDLIISDVMMPNMDGFEFCEKVKTDERTSHIPVILLTARAPPPTAN